MGQIITLDNLAGKYDIVIPNEPQFESEILFAGNKIEDQFWVAPGVPKSFSSVAAANKFWESEFERCYITGAWCAIKGKLQWIPPNYWFFLNHWQIKRELPEFRLKKLKHTQFKWHIRNDKRYAGTFTVKNRRDGETTEEMADVTREALVAEDAWFGIQSRNEKLVKDVCWRALMSGFKRLNPRFLMGSDGKPIYEGKTDATRLVFRQPKKSIGHNTNLFERQQTDDQDTIVSYASSGTDSFDGFELRRISLDEWLKWVDTDPLQALSTYIECVMPSDYKVGQLSIFSSPVEKKSKYTDDLYQFWKDCDPANPDPDTGICKTKIARWFSNPLEGIFKKYDKYGEANADEIHSLLMKTRASKPKSKRPAEVRKYPLNEQEAFGTYENIVQWGNQEGIEKRLHFLNTTAYKDEAGVEPKYIYGSLRWENAVPDTKVVFVPAYDLDDFDKNNRFAFAFMPPEMTSLYNTKRPPRLIDSMLGVDPFDYRALGKKPSNGAAIQYRFLDTWGVGRIKTIDSMYLGRPKPEIFYEDMIMYCVFTQSLCQVEDKNRKIIDYFEDRGYDNWMLPKDMWGDPTKKGNSPNGQSGFMDGIFALTDDYLSEPMSEDEQYNLDTIWIEHILKDVLIFNREDTHENDISMALGQALFGAQKWLARHRKRRPQSSEFADSLADCLF